MAILSILVLAAAIGLAVQFAVGALDLPAWSYYVVLPVLAFVLYVVNSVLIKRYIALRAPELASHERVAPGVEKWELTAGLGIVPKWVSYLGLAAIACLLALLLPTVASLLR